MNNINKIKDLTDEEVLQYLDEIGLDSNDYRCRLCNKLVQWKNPAKFILSSSKQRYTKKFKQLSLSNHDVYTFMTDRVYNGHEYHLHYCYNCACKLFPEILDKKFPLNPATNRSKVLFEISDEDHKSVTDKVCKRTKENYIKKYGEIEGLKKWNNYCNKQSYTNTFEYKQEKYGWTKEEFDNYNKDRASTYENFIKRYGQELGKQKWDAYIERERYTTSKEYFIEKYGDIEGELKFNEFCKLRLNNVKYINLCSNICNEFTLQLSNYFTNNKIYCNSLNNEYKVNNKYLTDYYDETLNIVIEFYGDYWHFNPKFYNENDKIFINNKFLSVKDKWLKDEERIKYIENYLNTKVIIVWENDYRKDKNICINNVLKEINNISSDKLICVNTNK